jgi:hypothetical protein
MQDKFRTPLIVTLIAAAIVLLAVLAITRLYRGDSALLREARFEGELITPNADGETDAVRVRYEITRDALVSIYLINDAGEKFIFRDTEPRGADQYSVLFSGIVDGYRLPDEQFEAQVVERLLQDGTYRWVIEATDAVGERAVAEGQLTIADADNALPIIAGYEFSTATFTPNRDGIDDRVRIQFDLKKAVETLRVYLLTPDGAQLEVSELPRNIPPKSAGRHIFDYEGGVDLGATPPKDGTYQIVAYAADAEGQKIQIARPLTLQYGGVPRAEVVSPVVGDTVEFSTTAVQLCDTIYFTATVKNYGEVPIRTTGPEPGMVYDSDWNYNSLGWNTESGAFRFAIGYEDEIRNYGFRWATGSREELTQIGDHYYLMPDQQVVITGGVRIVNELGERNPQPMYAGLIHEDVEIAQFNDRVDPKAVNIDYPPAEQFDACEAREVPVRQR